MDTPPRMPPGDAQACFVCSVHRASLQAPRRAARLGPSHRPSHALWRATPRVGRHRRARVPRPQTSATAAGPAPSPAQQHQQPQPPPPPLLQQHVPHPPRRPRLLRAGAALAAVAAAAAAVTAAAPALRAVPARLASLYGGLAGLHPAAATGVVALVNFMSVALCFPANMGLMISAGAALGPRNAFIALYTTKVLAACCTFLLARGVLADRAARMLDSAPRLKRILANLGASSASDSSSSSSVGGGGLSMVVMLRLSPFPGFMLNYLLSLTKVSFANYALGTAIGTLPSVVNLVLIGGAARDVGLSATGGSLSWLSLCIKLLCVGSSCLTMGVVTRGIRKAIADIDTEPVDGTAQVTPAASELPCPNDVVLNRT